MGGVFSHRIGVFNPTSDSGTALYWRIRSTDLDDIYLNYAEIEWLDESQTEISLTGTTPLSSTTHPDSSNANAFDNDGSTRWISDTSVAANARYIGTQFTSAVRPYYINILCAVFPNKEPPRGFTIEKSDDGATWTEYCVPYANLEYDRWAANGEGYNTFPIFPDGTANAPAYLDWRLRFYAGQNATFLSMSEVQFRETSGGADVLATPDFSNNWIISGGTVAGHSNDLVDDDTGTRWAHSTGVAWGSKYWAVRFNQFRDIQEVAVTAATSSPHFQYAPTDFALERSSDGRTTWVEVDRWTTTADWTSGETRVFTVA